MRVSEPDSTGRIPGSVTDFSREAQAQTAGWYTLFGRRTHARWRRRWWLHVLLFVLTLITTTVFGYALSASFSTGCPLNERFIADGYARLLQGGWGLRTGMLYSIPLLLILLAHEFGHYFTCRRWHVEASLPYFGPAPTLLGTVGAFIRIRSPIYSRRSLFDIGVSGPVGGFVLLLPFLIAGVWMSRVVHGVQLEAPFTFGTPLLLRAVEEIRFPGMSAADISLHPMAMAAWAGLLATAINLLPVGQLDGGHISYAVLGESGHRTLSLLLIALLGVCGFVYWPWWLWAAAMFFLRRHPFIYDQEPLGSRRHALAGVALLLLIVSMCIVPVR
jgi:membrane-associated protease RseP (regulator of RpoE activity)